MTDDFIDIETLEGQAALMKRAREAIDAIESVEAESADGLVRVRVNVSGVVMGIDLAEETVRLDRIELADSIASTAHLAAQKAVALVAAALEELNESQARILEQFEAVDPSAACALREITASTTPTPLPETDPLDFYSPFERRSASDGDADW